MNKKGYYGEYSWVLFIILGTLLAWAIVGLIVVQGESEKQEACKEIGFEEYGRWNNEDICKDSDGDYHFIEMECELQVIPLLREINCNAKEIKIGKVYMDKSQNNKNTIKLNNQKE